MHTLCCTELGFVRQLTDNHTEHSWFSAASLPFSSMHIRYMQLVRWQPIALREAASLVSLFLDSVFLSTTSGSLASTISQYSASTNALAAAFPLFGIQMYHKLGDQWATSLLAFLTLFMMPFPYIFFKYGKRIRGKSRFTAAP